MMMMKSKIPKHLFSVLLCFFAGLLVYRCANPASPTGGPKDETPPVVVSSEPENYSANFSEREMSVKFNEFVQLNELQQQLLISPPMETKPEIKIKKRSVVIKLDKEEQLRENTTYTIFLGNAVVDLTESNPYLNFEYVFSTGEFVDSLSIKGNVKNAFDGLPVESISVMLYTNENDTVTLDSLPIKVRPNYVAKTDEEGNFSLHNLRNVPYKIFALNDQNGNYLFDLPYEEVAFLDSMIAPYYTGKRILESLDSLALDSLNIPNYEYRPTQLSMFAAIDSTQDITEDGLLADYKYQFILKFPSESFAMKALNYESYTGWHIAESNKRNDTIVFWFRPNVQDSLEVEFMADGIILDTLDVVIRKPKKTSKKGAGKAFGLFKKKVETDSLKPKVIGVSSNIKGSTANLKQKVKLEFDAPVDFYDLSKIIWMEDSIVKHPPIYFSDSARRKLIIDKELEEKTAYELIIPDSTFTSIYELTNDSIQYRFQTKTIDQYGNLLITIMPEQDGIPWIVQLMSGEKVLQQRVITKTELLRYELMTPGTYKLRAIRDENNNGYWDTGNYAYKRQPEKIVYLETEIELRANWDYEENWNLK